jgi:hypothetical protein
MLNSASLEAELLDYQLPSNYEGSTQKLKFSFSKEEFCPMEHPQKTLDSPVLVV